MLLPLPVLALFALKALHAVWAQRRGGAALPKTDHRRSGSGDWLTGPLLGEGASRKSQAVFQLVSLGAGFASLVTGAGVALTLVPTTMRPFYGWLLAYEWTFFLTALLFGRYLLACYQWGRNSSVKIESTKGVVAPPWAETIWIGLVAAGALLAVPLLPSALGIRVMIAKIVMAAGLMYVAVVLLAFCFIHLSTRWFLAGRLGA